MKPFRIVPSNPPNFEQICAAIPSVRHMSGVVFAYGDAVYVPSGKTLPYDLRVHEATHLRQQAAVGVDAWWRRYLAEPGFRVSQEIEAYHAQYMAMGKAERMKHIGRIAGILCGPLYGGLLTFEEAKQRIRAGA